MRFSKRDALATLSQYSGITALLGVLPAKPILMVLNYHRIGNADETPYDPQVFSCTAGELDRQVGFLKRRFHLATLDEVLDIAESRRKPSGTVVLLTFDDGYLDNYQSAFPVLAAHCVQGVFFLPTAFLGSSRLSWWDTAAYIIKRSRKRKFRLGVPPFQEFDLDAEPARKVVAHVLNAYVTGSGFHRDSEPFLAMLEEACDSPRPDGSERCHMNWEEVATMLRGGMAIGSHAHSHEILSRLPAEEQLSELTASKRILEERLGAPVYALSYPVGLPESFSSDTRAAAVAAGYRLAFSFYGGFNRFGAIDPFDFRRQSGISRAIARFRLQTTLASVTGRYWF
jgi:peptidoglycan/xylan/chitin deacetylase (PgdA/CDA1 family)